MENYRKVTRHFFRPYPLLHIHKEHREFVLRQTHGVPNLYIQYSHQDVKAFFRQL